VVVLSDSVFFRFALGIPQIPHCSEPHRLNSDQPASERRVNVSQTAGWPTGTGEEAGDLFAVPIASIADLSRNQREENCRNPFNPFNPWQFPRGDCGHMVACVVSEGGHHDFNSYRNLPGRHP
jgi:hypothetical protein